MSNLEKNILSTDLQTKCENIYNYLKPSLQKEMINIIEELVQLTQIKNEVYKNVAHPGEKIVDTNFALNRISQFKYDNETLDHLKMNLESSLDDLDIQELDEYDEWDNKGLLERDHYVLLKESLTD